MTGSLTPNLPQFVSLSYILKALWDSSPPTPPQTFKMRLIIADVEAKRRDSKIPDVESIKSSQVFLKRVD